MNRDLVDAQIDKPPSLFDRCGRLWGSGSTGGRSSTPSEPGWPRPCPSPRHLHGSAFTASSSPHRYERGERLCPTDVLLGETAANPPPPAPVVIVFCHITGVHWNTFWAGERKDRERERERERGCISLLNLRRDIIQSFRRKWMTGDAVKGHCRLSKNERLVDQEDARDQAEFGSVWLWTWMYSTSYPLTFNPPLKFFCCFPARTLCVFAVSENSELVLLDCTELDSNQRTLDADPTGAATKLLKRHFQIVFLIPPHPRHKQPSGPGVLFNFVLCYLPLFSVSSLPSCYAHQLFWKHIPRLSAWRVLFQNNGRKSSSEVWSRSLSLWESDEMIGTAVLLFVMELELGGD